MLTREELLSKEGYWVAKIQNELFDMMLQYMEDHNLNRTQLAAKLGVSKGYVTQILNGDYDHRVSKLVSLALALGKVPDFQFSDKNEYLKAEGKGKVVSIKTKNDQKDDLMEG